MSAHPEVVGSLDHERALQHVHAAGEREASLLRWCHFDDRRLVRWQRFPNVEVRKYDLVRTGRLVVALELDADRLTRYVRTP